MPARREPSFDADDVDDEDDGDEHDDEDMPDADVVDCTTRSPPGADDNFDQLLEFYAELARSNTSRTSKLKTCVLAMSSNFCYHRC